MPELIESLEYAASKARLCDEHARCGDLIDAVEWELLHVPDCDTDDYPLIADTSKGRIRSYRIATISPGLVFVFGFEETGGTRKVLLLDVFASADDSDDDNG